MREMRNGYNTLFGKPTWKKTLGRSRRRLEDNIRMDREVVWKVVDWIHLAQDRDGWWALVNA
jgi:hypothetical protein